MLVFIFLNLLLLAAPNFGYAETEESIKEYEKYHDSQLKKAESKIPALVKQYATSIGCGFNFNPRNVVPYEIDGMESFVAVFILDVGCRGGSNTSESVFVVIERGANFSLFINTKYSAPHQTSDDIPQFVTRLFINKGKLWYKGLEFDFSKDSGCCPSIPIKAQLAFINGKWKNIPGTKSISNAAVNLEKAE